MMESPDPCLMRIPRLKQCLLNQTVNLRLLRLPSNNDRVIVKKYQTVGFCLHIDGIFNAGRFYAVNVDPPVNSNSIPTAIRGNSDELRDALDVCDEGWSRLHQVPGDQLLVLSGGEAKFAGGMHRHPRDSRAVLVQSLPPLPASHSEDGQGVVVTGCDQVGGGLGGDTGDNPIMVLKSSQFPVPFVQACRRSYRNHRTRHLWQIWNQQTHILLPHYGP